MEAVKIESADRVIFLDNLRYLFVIGVVVLHSGSAYFSQMRWWSVAEPDTSVIVGLLLFFLDAFLMPLLFYIAGYFAVPSIQRGVAAFLQGKLKRLGIPWIICILTVVPIVSLVYHFTRDHLTISISFWDVWMNLMKNALDLNIGLFSRDTVVAHDGFFQRYMWFISLLLLFFFVFSLIYEAKKKWFEDANCPVDRKAPSILSTLKLLGAVGLLSLLGSLIPFAIMMINNGSDDPNAWLNLGSVIQVQVTRIIPYIIYFGLGVVTYRNKWLERGRFPGHFKTWAIAFIILTAAYLYVGYAMLFGSSGPTALYGLSYFVLCSFLTMAVLGFSSSLALRYWNRPRTIDRNLALNSYDIYLSHYIFVFIFQLILFAVAGIPSLLKFFMVSAFSIPGAYLASQYLIRPYPKTAVALLCGILIAMFAVVRP